MNGLFKYADLSTKIQAMKGKMLDEEDYREMMHKTSVKDVALYLKEDTYYADQLDELNENDIHRGNLETLLNRSIVDDAIKIGKHLRGKEKRIFMYIYRKLVIEDFKKILRTLQMGESLDTIDKETLYLNPYEKIDYDRILQSRSITEFIETLAGTPFYNVLKPLIKQNGEIDLFAAEMEMDVLYFNRTYHQMKKFSTGKDQTVLLELLGIEADLKNIFWIYRSKKYYSISREMMFRYLIPEHHKIKRAELREMIEAQGMEAFIKVVEETYYGRVLDFHSDKLEIQSMSFIKERQERAMREEPFSIAPVIGYMFLKELEVLNITNIIEGIRYDVDPDAILDYIAGM